MYRMPAALPEENRILNPATPALAFEGELDNSVNLCTIAMPGRTTVGAGAGVGPVRNVVAEHQAVVPGRPWISRTDRAVIAARRDGYPLAAVADSLSPATILRWHRRSSAAVGPTRTRGMVYSRSPPSGRENHTIAMEVSRIEGRRM